MNNKTLTREFVLAGLFLALGILLPMVFHLFSMTGPIFLPMHIPVLIGGLFLSPKIALALGIVTPLISSVLTGMPVIIPMGIIMAFELGTYALSASIASSKFKLSTIPSLLIAMIAGRIAAGLAVYLLVLTIGVEMNPLLYVKGAIVTGIPGIVIQLLIIPALVIGIKRYRKQSVSRA